MSKHIIILLLSLMMQRTIKSEENTKSAIVKIKYVDFDKSMGFLEELGHKNFGILAWNWSIEEKLKFYKYFKSIYDENFHLAENPQREALIPKIIHQIWVGPNKQPEELKISQEMVKKLHPDWEYKLWTDEDVLTFNLFNKKLYDNATNYAMKADLLRYEILYRFGGVYMDIDFYCLKPFDIFHHSFDFYIGLEGLNLGASAGNSIIGAAPGHPVMEYCVKNVAKNWNSYPPHIKNPNVIILYQTGPQFFTKSFLSVDRSDLSKSIVLPYNYFYALNYFDRHKFNYKQLANKFNSETTFGIHGYLSSWKPKNQR